LAEEKKERNFISKTEYLRPLLRVGGGIIKRVISLTKGNKLKESVHDLNDPNHQNEIFRIAKQMVKEKQDIMGSNGVK